MSFLFQFQYNQTRKKEKLKANLNPYSLFGVLTILFGAQRRFETQYSYLYLDITTFKLFGIKKIMGSNFYVNYNKSNALFFFFSLKYILY